MSFRTMRVRLSFEDPTDDSAIREQRAGTVEISKVYDLPWVELTVPGAPAVLAQDIQNLFAQLKRAAKEVRKNDQ